MTVELTSNNLTVQALLFLAHAVLVYFRLSLRHILAKFGDNRLLW